MNHNKVNFYPPIRTAGATVARSTPDRKVIRSNRVWFNSYDLISFCIFVLGVSGRCGRKVACEYCLANRAAGDVVL